MSAPWKLLETNADLLLQLVFHCIPGIHAIQRALSATKSKDVQMGPAARQVVCCNYLCGDLASQQTTCIAGPVDPSLFLTL